MTRRAFSGMVGTAVVASTIAQASALAGPLGYDVQEPGPKRATLLDPTPACGAPVTRAQTAGPYYTPKTPRRSSFLSDSPGQSPLIIEGRVLSPDCRELRGAVLDFWHADTNGEYDNNGYRFRGHQVTDSNGVFRLETVKPGRYGSLWFARTPHVHVIVQGTQTAPLTTQLYFPNETEMNARDSIFHPALVMNLGRDSKGRAVARFDFVLQTT